LLPLGPPFCSCCCTARSRSTQTREISLLRHRLEFGTTSSNLPRLHLLLPSLFDKDNSTVLPANRLHPLPLPRSSSTSRLTNTWRSPLPTSLSFSQHQSGGVCSSPYTLSLPHRLASLSQRNSRRLAPLPRVALISLRTPLLPSFLHCLCPVNQLRRGYL
jgi:hypothetical protein